MTLYINVLHVCICTTAMHMRILVNQYNNAVIINIFLLVCMYIYIHVYWQLPSNQSFYRQFAGGGSSKQAEMNRGQLPAKQLSDSNWDAFNHASHAPQLLSDNYYVHTCTHILAYVHTCVHTYVRTHLRTYMCISHVHNRTHTCVCTSTRTHSCTCVDTCMHTIIHTCTYAHNSYLTVVRVHEMHEHDLMHPNYCQITILLVGDLRSSLAYFMMIQALPIVGKFPVAG